MQVAFSLRGHSQSITGLAFSNPYLISSDTNQILVWDITKRRIVNASNCNDTTHLDSMHLTNKSEGNVLVCQDRSGSIRFLQIPSLDPSTSSSLQTLATNSLHFCKFHLFMHDEQILIGFASAETSNTLDVFDVTSGIFVNRIIGIEKNGALICNCVYNKSGIKCLLGYESGAVVVMNASLNAVVSIVKAHSEPVMAVDVCVAIGFGVTVAADDSISRIALEPIEKENQSECRVAKLRSSGHSDVVWRPDGKVLAIASWNSTLDVYSAKKLQFLCDLTESERGCCKCLLFAGKDDRFVLFGGCDTGRIIVFE